ncbi:PQ-loop-domain-containing protein [Laetiporus sulphureus 93-53]|uniref:PQ-loop-domain-containing protein n=1 Tax=Laetiporus sulphureus 93-53 TaxID=1314785 RepID=A0A165HM27_9APHY|nr:PQ-loop-domain-containing protein [Laetiporus sulphureus 93-53]KZT11911.1 PQ-loop-domain-containing protein [Laetiporus sulphureus 93-53]
MDINGNQTLSNVLGWISIACWLVVYTPQIIENYQLKSGEGLSVLFIIIWLLGDLCNLVGAALAHLLPTIIVLAVYYLVCDTILLTQIYYYRWLKQWTSSQTPLLVADDTVASDPLEGAPLLARADDDAEERAKPPIVHEFVKYAGALFFVFAVGGAAWAVDSYIHKGRSRSKPEELVEWRSQVLGWISAVMYLGARVPQIAKNFKTRCEGLSPFLFVYSITGNTTYVLAIFAASMDMKHLIANASWIAGSALTIFLDTFVLCQFVYYTRFHAAES